MKDNQKKGIGDEVYIELIRNVKDIIVFLVEKFHAPQNASKH